MLTFLVPAHISVMVDDSMRSEFFNLLLPLILIITDIFLCAFFVYLAEFMADCLLVN